MTAALLAVLGTYALWLGGGFLVLRRSPEQMRMGAWALPVLFLLGGLTFWTWNEVEYLGSHLSFPLSLFGWLALALTCAYAAALCFRVSPGAAWALLGPPALLLLLWLSGLALSLMG